MHSWNIFYARTSHEYTRTHKTHHGPDLGEAITFPLIVFFVPSHKACTQMSFCLGNPKFGIPKFLKLGLLQFWRPITSCANLQLRSSLKTSCSPFRELSNDMLHATYTQINQGDFLLLMVGSQIGNLIPDPSLAITYVLSTQMGHESPF